MNTFIVRNDKSFADYAYWAYRYFIHKHYEGCRITIRKNNVFIHIDKYYCVICNDLRHLQRKGKLECNNKAKEWLNKY